MDRLLWFFAGGCFSVAVLAGAVDYSIMGNLRYDRYPETVLDILQPPHPALSDRPAVLMIHGGGWVGGSKNEVLEFCKPFLARDYVIANVEYRLADVAPAPAAVSDVRKASRWLVDHAAEYKIDPKKIVAAGFSAGGHLALMAGMATDEADLGPLTKFAGIIDFYGISDVAGLWQEKTEFVGQWLGPDANLDLARRVSPVTYVRKDVPPILIVHGDQDDVVPYQQSLQLHAALKKSGAKVEMITVPGGKHGFTPAQDAEIWPQIFKWLKKIKV